ncbi:hypothetical protein [Prevotella melaninogenica]|uniref:hypothetical protein n=1 Tax=Prevotella melaninogenica TaxID=28132 RepID=UPI001C608B65|nr:hypothetical protein [Prevotella melaninogenica]MBW4896930.1 hypothetical protein [Prevotella melaninogenica]UEB00585.1 hypothetical protein LK413_12750 [Prevotella melaninogenica]
MKTFKINAQGIGAAIGLLLVNGIVYLIFHRTPASEEEINAYIQNSEVVELTDFTFFDVERMVTYARQPLRRNNSTLYKNIAKVYSPDSKKNFVLETYDVPGRISVNTEILRRCPKIYLVVNKDDLHNPKLGSKEKPVPALLWYTSPDSKFNQLPEDDYKNNVKEYLTYCRTE